MGPVIRPTVFTARRPVPGPVLGAAAAVERGGHRALPAWASSARNMENWVIALASIWPEVKYNGKWAQRRSVEQMHFKMYVNIVDLRSEFLTWNLRSVPRRVSGLSKWGASSQSISRAWRCEGKPSHLEYR